MFKKSAAAPSPDGAPVPEPEPPAKQAGKGTPTPTRREREAANKRPLVPSDRKEAARQARVKNNEQRERARVGMAAGDDRYLTARDRGPQRRYVRDYVDARSGISEFILPIIVFFFLLAIVPAMQAYSTLVLYVIILIVFIDSVILTIRLQRRLAEKFGAGNLQRGLRWYAVMRSFQLRVMRLPKPQVRRRQFPS